MKEQIKKIIENYCQGIEWLEFNVADLDKMADEILALQLQQTGVVRSCSHENYTNYCNTDGSYSHKLCDDCFEILD
jgi:hypothetical protein